MKFFLERKTPSVILQTSAGATAQPSKTMTTKTATYLNTASNETYTLSGVKDLAHAWSLIGKTITKLTGWDAADIFVQSV
jgi:hypothetical protein